MISINQSIEKSNIYTTALYEYLTRTVLHRCIGNGSGKLAVLLRCFYCFGLLTIGVIGWLVGGNWRYHGLDHLGFWMRGSRALIDGLSFPSFFLGCAGWLVAAHVLVTWVTYRRGCDSLRLVGE
ncbi:hypothetical protein B9Z19DRAFT_1084050 [Tuber borchii]|uniref:Uncharacterized protein n=1 Tax=Tuber borchii TaxID=42251 RepID=A0A2T6ZSM9_TUBBO|nr:hypothetical protein B9Z19DRAFT_1084050 [Tuber borchii]